MDAIDVLSLPSCKSRREEVAKGASGYIRLDFGERFIHNDRVMVAVKGQEVVGACVGCFYNSTRSDSGCPKVYCRLMYGFAYPIFKEFSNGSN